MCHLALRRLTWVPELPSYSAAVPDLQVGGPALVSTTSCFIPREQFARREAFPLRENVSYFRNTTLEVAVGPSREFIKAVAPMGRHVSSPRAVTALIDTGAQSTVLKPELVAQLALRPVGVAPISTPSTGSAPLLCNRYHINVYFSEDFVIENVFAVEAPMGGVRYECLIGRDVLRMAVLLYDGRAKPFTLTF